MNEKRPFQLYILIICFIIGVFADMFMLYIQHTHKPEKTMVDVFIVILPSIILIFMSILLFIKNKIAYVLLWLMYLPISISGCIFVFMSLYFLNIFTILLPICGIFTIYSLTSKPLRVYFFNK